MTIFTEHAARGRTAWWRYPLAIVLALGLWLLGVIAVALPLTLSGLMPRDWKTDLVIPARDPAVFYIGNCVLVFGLFLLAFIVAVRLVHRKRLGDVVGPWSWRLFALGAGIWLGALIVSALIEFAVAPHAFRVSLSGATGVLAISALLGLGVQTFTEEYVFRGYLTQAFWLAVKRPWPAAILSGLVFGALHVPNGWPQAANAVLFGIVTARVAMRAGGIAFTYGVHLVNNLFAAVVVVSASDVLRGSPGLFTQTAPQLAALDVALGAISLLGLLWLTGGRSRWGAQMMRLSAAAS